MWPPCVCASHACVMSSAIDDVIQIDPLSSDLLITSPSVSWVNSTINITASCFTDLVRGDRTWDDLDRCVQVVFSFFSLQSVRIYGFPIRWVWPWDSAEVAAANASAVALNALNALAPSAAAEGGAPAYSGAFHVVGTDDDGHYHHDDDGYYVYPFDIVWFFLLFGFASLLCGASYTAYYYDDNGNLYHNGTVYKRVTKPAGEEEL